MKLALFALGLASLLAVGLFTRSPEPVNAAIEPAPAKPALAAKTFKVDPTHSSVVFSLRYQGVCDFHGRFDKVTGTFSVDPDDPTKSSFDLVIDAASVNTGNDQRNGHLRTPDFFSAKEHPEMRFKSSSVEKGKDGALAVKGELTLRGETKPVTAEVFYGGQVDDPRAGTRSGFDGVLVISRKDFGVEYGSPMLGDEVTIRAGITGTTRE